MSDQETIKKMRAGLARIFDANTYIVTDPTENGIDYFIVKGKVARTMRAQIVCEWDWKEHLPNTPGELKLSLVDSCPIENERKVSACGAADALAVGRVTRVRITDPPQDIVEIRRQS